MQSCKHISKGLKTTIKDAVNFPDNDYQHSLSIISMGELTSEHDENSEEDPDMMLNEHEIVDTTDANTDDEHDSSELEAEEKKFGVEITKSTARDGHTEEFFQLVTER